MINFNKSEFVTSFGNSGQLPESDKVEIAFAGRSNVGKSSAINKILNRKGLARVSAVPGKTATINFYSVDGITFVDLPGYGYAKVAKSEKYRWSELMEGYFAQDRNLQLVVSLVDMRHSPMQLDIDMANFLIDNNLPFVILLTKSDKLNKTEYKNRLEALHKEFPCGDSITFVPFSSETGEGVDKIKAIINEAVENYQNDLEEDYSDDEDYDDDEDENGLLDQYDEV